MRRYPLSDAWYVVLLRQVLFYVSRWWKGVCSLPLWLSLPIGNLDTPAFPLEMFERAAPISGGDLGFRPFESFSDNRNVFRRHFDTDAVESL